MDDVDVKRVRTLWRQVTDAPDGFAESSLVLVRSDSHQASPSGWIGLVEMEGQVVVACPLDTSEQIRHVLSETPVEQLTEPAHVDELLQPADTLGPALLFYGMPSASARSRHRHHSRVIGPLDLADPRVAAVLADSLQSESNEAGIVATTSGVFLALAEDGTPASVCAWREWPCEVAHMSSLTAMSCRGSGLGSAAAVAALDAAGGQGLLPQWRAGSWNEASIALARRLGLRLVGRQYSVLLPAR